MVTLNINKREVGNSDTLRKEDKIPAVVYGPKTESVSISVKMNEFLKVYKEAGDTGIVSLKGEGFEHDVLVHEISYDPVTDKPQHIDFYAIEKGQKVQVGIDIEFDGVSPAVKELGGTLMKVLHQIEVEGEPRNLPQSVSVDISILKDFESQIHASDIKLPNDVTLITDPEEVVALVQPSKEEVEEVTEQFDASKIEVEERGKKEEETPTE